MLRLQRRKQAMKYFFFNLMPRFNPDFCFLHDKPDELGLHSSRLSRGEPLAQDYPEDVRLMMSDDESGLELPDLVGNTFNVLICSAYLKKVLEKEARGPVEFLKVSIYNHRKRCASRDYFFVNPLGVVDCLDLKASKIEYHNGKVVEVEKAVFDPDKLHDAPALFRVREDPTYYVVSQDLVRTMAAMKPQPSNIRVIEIEMSGGKPK
jgi:hypothetical protein